MIPLLIFHSNIKIFTGGTTMAKHICAICGAEVNLLSEQKLADGNFICRKVCAKKCFKALDLVGGDLETVKAEIETIKALAKELSE